MNPTSIAPFGLFKIAILMRYPDETEWSYISSGEKTSEVNVNPETLDEIWVRSERSFETTNAVGQTFFVFFNPKKDLFVGDSLQLELPNLFGIDEDSLADGDSIFQLVNAKQEALSKQTKKVFLEDIA